MLSPGASPIGAGGREGQLGGHMATRTAGRSGLIDRQLLNAVQSDFPLCDRPFRELGARLGVTESDAIARVARLEKHNVIRQIGAIFDTRRLGYKTTLAAFRMRPGTLEKAAREINKHPGVSHNYARNGHYNLWFTIAVPPHEDLSEIVDRLAQRTGAVSARMMPTIRFFKIGVNFDMVKNEGAAYEYFSPDGYGSGGSAAAKKPEIRSDWERGGPHFGARHRVHPGASGGPASHTRALRPHGGALGHDDSRAVRMGWRSAGTADHAPVSAQCFTTAAPGSAPTAWLSGRCPRSAPTRSDSRCRRVRG